MEKIVSSGVWTVEETVALERLEIAQGASVAPPAGKSLTMTVNGVGTVPAPGVYTGKVVLTVAEDIPYQFFCRKEPDHYRAAICVQDGQYVPEKSVAAMVQGGSVGAESASGVTIVDKEEAFNGIFVEGDGAYTVSDVKIDLTGNGANDFAGFGAAIMSAGNATLTVNNADVNVCGAARGGLFIGGNSTMVINNSRIAGHNGTLPEGYKDTIALGEMKCVPWMLGLRGNCRVSNLADYGSLYVNNSHISAEGWGVLSTDVTDKVRMFVKDSTVEITGESGYGTFTIGDSYNVFENTVFHVPDYAVIMANGMAGGAIRGGSKVEAGRFAVMSFMNEGGTFTVSDSQVNTGKACFMVKGCAPQFEVENSVLNSKEGVLLQVIDCDDPGNPGGWYVDPEGEDTYRKGRCLVTAEAGKDPFLRMRNMEATGDIYNATTNLEPDTSDFPPMDMPMPMDMDGGGEMPVMPLKGDLAKNLDVSLRGTKLTGRITASRAKHPAGRISKENCQELGNVVNTPCPVVNNGVIVSVLEGSVWTVTDTCYLSCLVLEAGSSLQAPAGKKLTLTVDGQARALVPGIYTGAITLTIS